MTKQQNEDWFEFVWTFPCYILAGDHRINPETGEVIWDEKVRFVTPELQEHGERAIAVFTDLHLAEDFRDHMTSSSPVAPLGLPTPVAFLNFLGRARDRYRLVAVDLSRQHPRPTRMMEVSDLIRELSRLTGHQGDQDHPS